MYWKPCKFNVTPRNKEADDSVLKGHSQLWKRADLDTSFLTLKKSSLQPEIKVHLEMRFNFCNVCLIFNRLLKKTGFECPFAHPMILVLSYHIWLERVFIASLLYAN